jgi:S1-C subfamily serine protease
LQDRGRGSGHADQSDPDGRGHNESNSGGPLVNIEGQVVGINSLGTAGAQSIAFAIAIDEALPVLERLERGSNQGLGRRGASLGGLFAPPVEPLAAFSADGSGRRRRNRRESGSSFWRRKGLLVLL